MQYVSQGKPRNYSVPDSSGQEDLTARSVQRKYLRIKIGQIVLVGLSCY